MFRPLALATLALLAAGCGQDTQVPAGPGFLPPPIEAIYVLDFGEVAVGEQATTTTVVRAGDDPVLLSPPDVKPPFSANVGEVVRIEPRAEKEVVFTFAPTDPGTYEQEIVLRTNGAAGTYRLSGRAVPPPPACEPGERTDVYEDVRPRIDVLLVVEDHASMDAFRDRLVDEGTGLPRVLSNAKINWQLGVTSTGVGACGGGALRGDRAILSWLTADAGARLEQVLAARACNGSAQGLEATLAAVDAAGDAFRREEAALALVVISTRDDKSPERVASYTDALVAEQPVRMLAVVGEDGGRCTGTEPGTRYAEAVSRIGGFRRSICGDDWGLASFFADEKRFGMPTRYPLESRPADENGDGAITDAAGEIEVRVDGELVPSGGAVAWRYDAARNVVIFAKDAVPGSDQRVEIGYRGGCD